MIKFGLDPHPLERAGTGAILLVSLMQLVEIALFLAFPSAIGATPLLALLFTAAGRTHFLAAGMLVSIALAAIGAFCRIGWPRLLLLIPQHFLLGVMALGYVAAAFRGSYLDATPMGWPHIAAEATIVTTLWLVHSHAIVRRARDPNG